MLRRAGLEDVDAARQMHRRCSAMSLQRRYHGPVSAADRYLGHLLDPRHGHCLAAETASGELVGLAQLLRDGNEAEVALLVADAWQRRGVGSALLRWLLETATAEGFEAVYAVTQPSNDGMVALMCGTGLPVDCEVDGRTLVLAVRPRPLAVGVAALPVHTGS